MCVPIHIIYCSTLSVLLFSLQPAGNHFTILLQVHNSDSAYINKLKIQDQATARIGSSPKI